MARDPETASILQGTLDVMILRTLERGEHHGYAIARAIAKSSGGVLALEEGTLYPALYRLERRGDVTFFWGTSELNRKAKFYRLSAKGKKRLVAELSVWERVSTAVDAVLHHSPGGATTTGVRA